MTFQPNPPVMPASDASATALPLIIPEGIRYNCLGCGKCCRSWAVGMTAEDYDRVKDIDWGAVEPQLAGQDLFVHRQKEFEEGLSLYPHYTKARPDATCSFLFDNKCLIHAKFGEMTKPRMCRLFPYSFVATPSGIYVGLSWNSVAVMKNSGELLTNQREYLESVWREVVDQSQELGKASEAEANAARTATARTMEVVRFDVNLVPGVPLEWSEYMTLENRMIEFILDPTSPSIFDALIKCTDLLMEAVRLKNANESISALSKFATDTKKWQKSEPGFFEGRMFNLLCFKNYVWPVIRETYSDKWSRGAGNAMTDPKVISAAVDAVLFDKMPLKTLGQQSISKCKKYKVDNMSPETIDFVRRALYVKIFGKVYCGTAFSGLSVVSGFNTVIGGLLCAVVLAKANAMSHNTTALAIEDFWDGFYAHDKEGTSLSQLDKEKASFYDLGFSSPRLFTRLLSQMNRTVGSSN